MAGVLQDHFNISLTPGRNTFLCYQCKSFASITSWEETSLCRCWGETAESAGTRIYVGQKLSTLVSSKKVVKRQRVSPNIHRVLFSPRKISHKSSSESKLLIKITLWQSRVKNLNKIHSNITNYLNVEETVHHPGNHQLYSVIINVYRTW